MSAGSVVYSPRVQCAACGLTTTAYLQITPDGKGASTCPRCGAQILADPPHGAVPQIPAVSYTHPVHQHVRGSHYPGLYMQPKHAPRYSFGMILRLPFSPTRAFTSLYLSTTLSQVMVVVAICAMVSTAFGMVVTEDMAPVLGDSPSGAFEVMAGGVIGWIVSMVSFLIFGTVAAIVANKVFGGRGDKSATISLVGCCYPWFVVLATLLLSIFAVGFHDLELSEVQDWSDSEMSRAIAWGSVVLVVAVLGFIWMLMLVSRAISVANDVSRGGGAMAAVLAAIAAGILSLLVDSIVRLPIGLTF